ncbi:MAG TPA: amidohydrolase family protein [Actinomycetota bacterium]|jgi:hypothetical protein
MGVDDVGFVDHHCHGVVTQDLDRPAFERMLSESFDPPPEGTTQFDSPFGLAVRRWCAPVLDLEPFPAPDDYLRRRAELGADEVARRFLAEAGLESLLIDTGYRSQELHDLDGMRQLSGRPVHEVVRLEAVAERVAVRGVEAASYAAAFADALEDECRDAVGLKTIVAYRGGFEFDPEPPSGLDVTDAAGAFLRQASTGRPRLADQVLLRFGIWTGARLARERGFPIQFHVGWGDPDLTLHRTNPSLLTDLIRAFGTERVNVVLLHCYPFHRVAGYLASMFANVHLDVGSALHFHGPSSATLLAEAMEVAPFSKLLYSSDAFGVAEGYHLGALLHRRAMRQLLDRWIGEDSCDAATADRIAEAVARGNAHRIYPVPG